MGELMNYITAFGFIGAAVFAAIKGIDKITGISPRWNVLCAVLMGTAGGIITHGIGLIKSPTVDPRWGFVGAGFFGLMAALSAASMTDLNVVEAMKKQKEL